MTEWQRWVVFTVLAAVLVAAAIIDWRTEKIPNRLTMPAVLFGLLFWPVTGFLVGGWDLALDLGIDASVAFAVGLFGFMVVILTTGGLGFGDMKMMAAVGAISSRWEIVLATTFYGLIICALMAIVLMVKHRRVKRTFERLFGAALLAGGRVKADLDNEPEAPKVPFAFGACIGGILATAEILLGLPTPWASFGQV